MDKKPRPMYMLCTWDPLLTERHIQTESERMEKDENQKKVGVAILISDKTNLKIRVLQT